MTQKILFLRSHINRLSRLLNMMYRPSEIAEEIGVNTETVYRSYLPGGCPFEQDKAGNYWIHGLSFVAWVRSVKHRSQIASLADGEGFCLKCQRAVEMTKPRLKHKSRYTAIFQGRCPVCGGKVNRAYAASAATAMIEEGASGD